MTFNNRCCGLVVIRSENSNWNADFSGFPRRLPDEKGTIYATDKALKYAIRKYFIDTGERVFVWKSHVERKSGGKKKKKSESSPEANDAKIIVPRKLEQRFSFMKEVLNINDDEKKDNKIIYKVFSKCLDVKLFGIAFTVGDSNISLTGPLQFSYGINMLDCNRVYTNQILSPYLTEKQGKKEEDEEARASTLGSEVKALTSYYVYDFVLNPRNISDHMEDFFKDNSFVDILLTGDDILKLKKALNRAATNLNTAAKIGNDNVMTLFITLNENEQIQLPSLKHFVNIRIEDDHAVIDLGDLKNILDSLSGKIEIELFKNDQVCKVINHGDSQKDKWIVDDILG